MWLLYGHIVRELDEMRRYIRARLHALELAEDPLFHDQVKKFGAALASGHKPNFMNSEQLSKRFQELLNSLGGDGE